MKKIIIAIALVSLAGYIGNQYKALASYYDGDKYLVNKTAVGILAGTSESCKIPKGSIVTVVSSLQRYNMLVVKSSNACISLLPLGIS